MALNEFQKAFLKNILVSKDGIIDPATGAPLDWSGLGGASDAASVTVTPAGNLAATDVQAALEELDAEKQPLDSDLTAIAALSTTAYGRALLALADQAALKTATGLTGAKIQVLVDGGGSTISTGIAARFVVPWNCTVTDWSILADQTGSIQFDLWKDTYANYPPTIADTITGSAKPLISSAAKNQSSTLTGWTTTLTAGDVVLINVDSVTAITSALLALSVTRS